MLDAHVTDFDKPNFDDALWKDLEEIIGVRLNQEARSKVEAITTKYCEDRAGSGCLNRYPRMISGFSAGFLCCGMPHSGCDAGRA
jgi:hypothetical protein